MQDWTDLYEDERRDIENKLMKALSSLGIKGAVTRWNMPAKPPHWQLIIQSSWCTDKTHQAVTIVLEQAMARAGIQAPRNGIVFSGPPENQENIHAKETNQKAAMTRVKLRIEIVPLEKVPVEKPSKRHTGR